MNNRIIIIILSSIIVLLVTFGFVSGIYSPGKSSWQGRQHGWMMDPMGPGRPFCTPEFMRDKLELSEEQISKITILNDTFEKEHERLFKSTLPYRDKLRELLKQDNPDMNQVRKLLEKISAADVEIQILRIKQGRTISSMLTPEQNEKLRREHRMSRKMMGPDGPGPGPGGPR